MVMLVAAESAIGVTVPVYGVFRLPAAARPQFS